MFKKSFMTLGLTLSSIFILSACGNQNKAHHVHNSIRTHRNIHVKHRLPSNNMSNVATNTAEKTINYEKPSEHNSYPRTLNANNNRILVSIKQQRAYIQKKNNDSWETIYTMYASTGSHNRTPRGKFHINRVKTNWFYSSQEHEGADYGTGWHDGGTYLFHATPANPKHQIFKHVAKDLGKKPSSHGCVHLTIPDAKYIYENAPQGMPVIIK